MRPIEKILFTTTFKEFAFKSLETMFVLKDCGMREILLCHIISRDEVGFVPFGGYLKKEEERLVQETRIKFEDWQRTLKEKGIGCRIIISVGDPVHEILHIADDEDVDLVVVGKKEKTLIGNPFISSCTLEILRRCDKPVLMRKYVVRYKLNDEELAKINDHPFDAPMLVTDWSETSMRAMEFMTSLKGAMKKAILFHNIDKKTLRDKSEEELKKIEQEEMGRLEHHCNLLKESGIETECHLGAGETVEEILRISRERQASMIIIGTTRKDRLHELFTKSVSHEIAKISELPTLLVP